MTISVIIITKNEEKVIGRCLQSVSWADEIIVVDSGSTDATEEICRSFPKLRFSQHPWHGFGVQKNAALALATSEWVLSIDADEVITPELANEIRTTLVRPEYDGYLLRRKNFYRNKWVRYSGWWPDEIIRLFRKEKGRFCDRLVHEYVELFGSKGKLHEPFEHYSYSSASQFLRKIDVYSSLGARQMFEKGRKTSIFEAIFRAVYSFVKTYIIKKGILDGRVGFLIAVSNFGGVFFKYYKCLELYSDDAEKNSKSNLKDLK